MHNRYLIRRRIGKNFKFTFYLWEYETHKMLSEKVFQSHVKMERSIQTCILPIKGIISNSPSGIQSFNDVDATSIWNNIFYNFKLSRKSKMNVLKAFKDSP